MKITVSRYRDNRPRAAPTAEEARGRAIAKAKKKKKQEEPGTALAVIPKKKVSTDKALSHLERTQDVLKKASTTFGVPSKQLYAMIQDGQTDQAIAVFQKQMLATMVRLIPIAENQYRREKKEHTAYALNSLVSQARELAADIQASADRAQIAERIIAEYWVPTFTAFVQTLVTEAQVLKSGLRTKMRREVEAQGLQEVDDFVRSVARTGNELFRVNSEGLRSLLGAPKKRGAN